MDDVFLGVMLLVGDRGFFVGVWMAKWVSLQVVNSRHITRSSWDSPNVAAKSR